MPVRANLISLVAAVAALLAVKPAAAGAQGTEALPLVQTQAQAQAAPEQLDQMLAPFALYPDPLVAQILMAATYPLEVVEAHRWLQSSGNAALKGGELEAALEPQPWDPSVKALILFPDILGMMDGNLEWTERLGNAFLAGQDAVMDSVQRLRQRAEVAGQLASTPRQDVSTEGDAISIQPTDPDFVYVPMYDPSTAYGGWPYPAFPPFYFPDYFDTEVTGDAGWFGVAIVAGLWGWDRLDWAERRIVLDRERWTSLSHRPLVDANNTWTHDPSHRPGVALGDLGPRERFGDGVAPLVVDRGGVADRGGVGNLAGPAVQFRPPAQAALPRVVTPAIDPGDRRANAGREFASRQSPHIVVPASPPQRREAGFEGRGRGLGRR
jgi:hypothetical protein